MHITLSALGMRFMRKRYTNRRPLLIFALLVVNIVPRCSVMEPTDLCGNSAVLACVCIATIDVVDLNGITEPSHGWQPR